jgi:hypothetical protein
VVYASLKVPFAIWFGDYDVDDRIRRIAPALAVALAGAALGIVFLSWAYKDILYMVFGASAALYGAARAQDSRLRLRISAREFALVVGAMFALLTLLYITARLRGR